MRLDPPHCFGREEHLAWALVHDLIAHPLLAITLYSQLAVAFHRWTSLRAWPRNPHEVEPK